MRKRGDLDIHVAGYICIYGYLWIQMGRDGTLAPGHPVALCVWMSGTWTLTCAGTGGETLFIAHCFNQKSFLLNSSLTWVAFSNHREFKLVFTPCRSKRSFWSCVDPMLKLFSCHQNKCPAMQRPHSQTIPWRRQCFFELGKEWKPNQIEMLYLHLVLQPLL